MERRDAARAVLALFLAVAAIDLYAEAVRWVEVAQLARWVLMPILAFHLVLAAPRGGRLVVGVVLALLLSGLGDVAPSLLVKFGLFGAAQIAYAVAFAPYWPRSLLVRPARLLLYLLVLGGLVGTVAVLTEAYRWPVIIYGVTLAAMGLLAFGVNRTTGAGAALFILSDIVLAVRYFVDPDLIPYTYLVNMGLYLPAQLIIVLGVLRQRRRPGR